jgi:hypothetical protein
MPFVAVLLAVTVSAPSGAEGAALLQSRGDPAAALAAAETLLRADPANASASFVAACAAIESGDLDGAGVHIARLEAARDTHATVLKRLVARRRGRGSSEPLREALVAAWKSAGRPDLGEKPLLRGADAWGELPRLEPVVRSRLTAGERFMFDPPSPAKAATYCDAAVAGSADAETNELALNLEILAALTPYAVRPAECPEAARAAARVGPVVVSADPENGYLAIAAILAAATGPFRPDELAAIERAARATRFAYPRARAFGELRTLASRRDLPGAEFRAWSAALGASVPLYRLWQRAEATEDPVLRERAGHMLVGVSRRLRDAETTLDRALSLALAERGAQLLGDCEAIAAAAAEGGRWRAWQRRVADARTRLGNWPFAAEWREWTPDGEIAFLQRLVD